MILRGVARNPAVLRGLVSTGIEFNRALRSLRGARDLLLSGLLSAEHFLDTEAMAAAEA